MPSVCVFAPSASLHSFSSCSLHDHINRTEATDGEGRGELLRLDAKGNRYVRCGRADLRERLKFAQPAHPGMSRETILAFSAGEPWAIRKVEGLGDVLLVYYVTYDQQDVWFGKNRGKPVFAVLKRKDLHVAEECRRYLTRKGTFKISEGLMGLSKIVNRPRLSDIWPRVFVQFIARDPKEPSEMFSSITARGRFRKLPLPPLAPGADWLPYLSVTPPEDLPAAIVFWTIAAYMRGDFWPTFGPRAPEPPPQFPARYTWPEASK